MTPWTWWAGEIDDDTYGLAEAATREDVIREASQVMRPGDKFRIVEARASTAAQHEGSDCVPFLRTRNHEIITVGPVEVGPAPQTNVRTVAEIPMTAFADAAPQRDEFKHEQTILTYSANVGTWDLSFFEAGEEFPEKWFGDTHWIDITKMWPGVIAQVASFVATKEGSDNDR